ncbi:MAG: GAF domain-containing protein [Deltaproteobacteria bacterium]|nr:GAF domain-containing protein [Deltaproteobacteria bacterium]
MKKDEPSNEEYVLQVRENTQNYIEALIEENGRLRLLVSDLEEQRQQTDRQLGIAESELGRIESERQKLAERIDQIEVESQDLLGQFHEIERQNSDLASLYVASYRLHETIKRSEVIAVIEEIIVNMIGSEELAIFEMDAESGKLILVDSLGIDPEDLARVTLNESRIEEAAGVLQEVVETGQRYVVESGDGKALEQNSGLTACVPLVLDDKVIGAIAVFRLLDQKESKLTTLDFELFDLLATHAAAALYCSERASAK